MQGHVTLVMIIITSGALACEAIKVSCKYLPICSKSLGPTAFSSLIIMGCNAKSRPVCRRRPAQDKIMSLRKIVTIFVFCCNLENMLGDKFCYGMVNDVNPICL